MVALTEALAATQVARHVETLVELVEGAQVVLPVIHNAIIAKNMAILQKIAIRNKVMIWTNNYTTSLRHLMHHKTTMYLKLYHFHHLH